MVQPIRYRPVSYTLSKDFDYLDDAFKKAWPIYIEYRTIPKNMTQRASDKVLEALSALYKSVKFIYKIALLSERGIIDKELLYILYFDEITDNLSTKLTILIQWCNTGLDLAANYSYEDLFRIITTLVKFLSELDKIFEQHGANLDVEGRSNLEPFNRQIKEFLANQAKYDITSPDCIAHYVNILGTNRRYKRKIDNIKKLI